VSTATTAHGVQAGQDLSVLRRRAILSCVVGNFFELFDFAIYGFFAASIGRAFFPATNPAVSLLSSFATYGVGFIMRPVGAIVIGAYGDRHGRKAALVLTVTIMATATALTGLIPGYATIGVLAPALLVLCRLVQGFSTGGEWGGAAAFLVEYAPEGKRGYFGSWQQFSVGLGLLAGSGAAYALTTFMDPASLALWGWRVPFVFGFLLAPVGYYLRSRVGETPAFERTLARHEVAASPLRLALTIHRAKVLTGLGLTVIWTVSSYLFLTFMPSYVTQTLHMPASVALASNTVAILILTVLTPLMGALSDRIGRRKMLLTSAIGYLVLSYPLFLLVTERRDFLGLAIAQAVAAVLLAIFSGPGPALLCEMFPTSVRYTSLSLGYNVAVAVFGGFAPFIAIALVQWTGDPIAPTYYVMAAALVSTLVILRVKDRTHMPLQ